MNFYNGVIKKKRIFGTEDRIYEAVDDQPVGRGGFAEVYKAVDSGGRLVAVKCMNKTEIERKRLTLDRVWAEIKSQYELSEHENVVKFIDAWYNDTHVYIVTEFCANGDLKGYLNKNGPLPEDVVRVIMMDVVEGLRHIHSSGFMHRDLTLANIFITSENRYKIGDFGLVAKTKSPSLMSPTSSSPSPIPNTHQTLCGTPSFLPPEMVNGKPYTSKVDIWGLGNIMYHSLVGKSAFDTGHLQSTKEQIVTHNPHLPSHLSAQAVHLINALLQKDDKERITLDEVRKHPFLMQSHQPQVSSYYAADSGLGTSRSKSTTSPRLTNSVEPSPLSFLKKRCGSAMELLPHQSHPILYSTKATTPPPAISSSPSSPRLSSRLNAVRLKASLQCQEIRPGVRGRINPNREVEFHFDLRKQGKSVSESIFVSENGDDILVTRKSASVVVYQERFKYENLPVKFYNKYNLIQQFVQIQRSQTPKLIIYCPDGTRARLMEDGPDPHFDLLTSNQQVKISLNPTENRVKYYENGGKIIIPFPPSAENTAKFPLLKLFSALRRESKSYEEMLERTPSLGMKFPCTFGSKKLTNSSNNDTNTMANMTLSQIGQCYPQFPITSTAVSGFNNQSSAISIANISEFGSACSSVQKLGNTYTWEDNSAIENIRKGNPTTFTYRDQSGSVRKWSHTDRDMPQDVRDKFMAVIKYKRTVGEHTRSHRSSPS